MATSEFDDRGVIVPCPNCGQKNRLAYERFSDPVRCGRKENYALFTLVVAFRMIMAEVILQAMP